MLPPTRNLRVVVELETLVRHAKMIRESKWERSRLLVFTRYPEPGKTKTRLIPALGAMQAAQLQQRMTEHTLEQIQPLLNPDSPLWQRSLSVDIRFAGGDLASMQAWLGYRWLYTPQGEGNLGDRLHRAFQSAFQAGITSVVAIGIDCPALNAERLAQSYALLQIANIVLGPATDGGYYLLGLNDLIPELFQTIDWGTDAVLKQTVQAAEQSAATIAYLDPLSDVDRPEDLHIWDIAQTVSQSGAT